MKKFTLARLKWIVTLVGFVLTTATLLNWGFPLPAWAPAAAALATSIGVYLTPNLTPEGENVLEVQPRRALVEDEPQLF